MKKIMPMLGLFVAVTMISLIFKDALQAAGINHHVVIGGNLLIFAATLLAYLLYAGALSSAKTYGFLGRVYGGFILKLILLLAGVMAYLYFAKPVNKPGLFICMGLYLVYSFLQTTQVVKNKGEAKRPGA